MRYCIYENGRCIGEAECEFLNTKLVVNACCEYFDGIKRLRLVDKHGSASIVSVLEPENGRMKCSKTMSLSSLTVSNESDISHFDTGENSMPTISDNDWRDFTMLTFPIEPYILDICMENNDKLIINDEKRALAHEYSDKSELIFVCAAVFLQIIAIDGTTYAALSFDEYGFPKYCEDI